MAVDIVGRALDLIDADHFTRRETYLADGKEDTEVLRYQRVR